jgi:hypothetical protein
MAQRLTPHVLWGIMLAAWITVSLSGVAKENPPPVKEAGFGKGLKGKGKHHHAACAA